MRMHINAYLSFFRNALQKTGSGITESFVKNPNEPEG